MLNMNSPVKIKVENIVKVHTEEKIIILTSQGKTKKVTKLTLSLL